MDRDIFTPQGLLQQYFRNMERSEFVTTMTLRSALQDVKETTLTAVAGLLGKLAYLASLRAQGRYAHWGMETLHGPESSERALKTAHREVVAEVLRTPLAALVNDLEQSSKGIPGGSHAYVEELREHAEELRPDGRQNAPASSHLNSVLLALSSLEKNRGRATRSTS